MTIQKLISKYEDKPLYVNLYNKELLKKCLDIALTEFFEDKDFKCQHSYVDASIILAIFSKILILVIVLLQALSIISYTDKLFLFILLVTIGAFVISRLVIYFCKNKIRFNSFDICSTLSDEGEYVVLVYPKNKNCLPKKYIKSIFDLFYEGDGRFDHGLFLTELEDQFGESLKNINSVFSPKAAISSESE